MGAEQLLKICIIILTCGQEDPQDGLAEGPGLEYLEHLRCLLAWTPQMRLNAPPKWRSGVALVAMGAYPGHSCIT